MIDVKKIRSATGLTQPQFAELYQIPVGTVRIWERGARKPTGSAYVLLKLIKREPGVVARILAGDNALGPSFKIVDKP
jgi:putative transcriptional regulator